MFHLNNIGMDYEISYTIPCGKFSMLAYSYEVAGILRNMALLAIGNKIRISNVTIKSV